MAILSGLLSCRKQRHSNSAILLWYTIGDGNILRKKGDTFPNQACKINMSINISFVTIFSQKHVIISKAMMVSFRTGNYNTYFDFTACSHLPPMLWNSSLNMISVVHVQKIELLAYILKGNILF